MGTATGSLVANRGARVSTDDSYYFVPYDPSGNADYLPDIAKNYVGLISIATDTGAVYWHMMYTPSTQFALTTVDGDVSPDNQRYYYQIRSTSAPFTGGIIVVKVTDGTIVKYMNYGDADLTPFALTVNKLDRLAFISRVSAGSTS